MLDPLIRRGPDITFLIEVALCPLLAQSGHLKLHRTCPLSGVKRTSRERAVMSAKDPKQSSRQNALRHIETYKRLINSAAVFPFGQL